MTVSGENRESEIFGFVTAVFARGKKTGAAIFAVSFGVSYGVMWLTSGEAGPVLDRISRYSTWAVPLMLATSLALFSSLIQIYDLIGQAYEECQDEDVDEQRLDRAVDLMRVVLIEVVGNAFVSLGLVVVFFLVAGIREIPAAAFPYPDFFRWLRPDWFAASFLVGVAALILGLLVNQFVAIPSFVDLYKYLALDRKRESSGEKDA